MSAILFFLLVMTKIKLQETRVPFPQYSTLSTQPSLTSTMVPLGFTTTSMPPFQQTSTTTPSYTTRGAPIRTTSMKKINIFKNHIIILAEPDALPCVMIQIRTGQKVCACQENYKQCTDNVCCNVGKYRNLRVSFIFWYYI